MHDDLSRSLAENVKALREQRGLSQQQIARAAGITRATWTNLESGDANPTLSRLVKVAAALGVTIEELIAPPRAVCRHYPVDDLKAATRGDARLRKLLPDPIPGLDIERLELPRGGLMVGVPHTAGTREYLTCEAGSIQLAVAGESWRLDAGEVVVFRGDQKHSYRNVGRGKAVGYSVVVLAPGAP